MGSTASNNTVDPQVNDTPNQVPTFRRPADIYAQMQSQAQNPAPMTSAIDNSNSRPEIKNQATEEAEEEDDDDRSSTPVQHTAAVASLPERIIQSVDHTRVSDPLAGTFKPDEIHREQYKPDEISSAEQAGHMNPEYRQVSPDHNVADTKEQKYSNVPTLRPITPTNGSFLTVPEPSRQRPAIESDDEDEGSLFRNGPAPQDVYSPTSSGESPESTHYGHLRPFSTASNPSAGLFADKNTTSPNLEKIQEATSPTSSYGSHGQSMDDSPVDTHKQESSSLSTKIAETSSQMTNALTSLVSSAFSRGNHESEIDPGTMSGGETNRSNTPILHTGSPSPIFPVNNLNTSQSTMDKPFINPETQNLGSPILSMDGPNVTNSSLSSRNEPSIPQSSLVPTGERDRSDRISWRSPSPLHAPHRTSSPVVVIVPQQNRSEIGRSAEYAVATPTMSDTTPENAHRPRGDSETPEQSQQDVLAKDMHNPQPSVSHLDQRTIPNMQNQVDRHALSSSPLSMNSSISQPRSQTSQIANTTQNEEPISSSAKKAPSFASFLGKRTSTSKDFESPQVASPSNRVTSFAGFLGTKAPLLSEKVDANSPISAPSFLRRSESPPKDLNRKLTPTPPQLPSFKNFLLEKSSLSKTNDSYKQGYGIDFSPGSESHNNMHPPRAVSERGIVESGEVSPVSSSYSRSFGIANEDTNVYSKKVDGNRNAGGQTISDRVMESTVASSQAPIGRNTVNSGFVQSSTPKLSSLNISTPLSTTSTPFSSVTNPQENVDRHPDLKTDQTVGVDHGMNLFKAGSTSRDQNSGNSPLRNTFD